jgi:hypothetical protein
LERPLCESNSLSELRKRLFGLLQSSKIPADIIKSQYLSLQVWEAEEQWLASVEKLRSDARVDERNKSHAVDAMRDLDALTNMSFWRPYIPTDRPTVFAVTKSRLQAITGKGPGGSRPVWPLLLS